MSITEKLGKAGVPGFRSEKKWKMLLASMGYFWIFSIILLVVLVPTPETTASDGGKVTATPNPMPSTSTPTPTTAKIIETSTSTPTPTPPIIEYDDLEYTVWAGGALKILSSDMFGISDAASVYDMKSMEIHGRYLKEDSQKYLNEIEQYKLSPLLKPSADELKKALENFILAGKYTEQGAINLDADYFSLATDYTLEGNANLKRATAMLPTT